MLAGAGCGGEEDIDCGWVEAGEDIEEGCGVYDIAVAVTVPEKRHGSCLEGKSPMSFNAAVNMLYQW